ncbi:hypothetical protein GCM10017673_20630 [Streptosporangium violaceochromogenes]|nr:hypothetical protein GCM10017673_20630 [Streptosporangium violaceochromogenes]
MRLGREGGLRKAGARETEEGPGAPGTAPAGSAVRYIKKGGNFMNSGRKKTDLSSVTDVAVFSDIPKSSKVISAMCGTGPGAVS